MDWIIVGIIIALILLYTVISDFFPHRMGIGAWKRHYRAGVVLTFDDGPDPDHTGKFLDLLKENETQGVFFLVAEQAQRHPEIVKEILEQGHQIGLHGMVHQHGWRMGPFRTWQNWTKGKQVLEAITGGPVVWMRPPWGVFNLISLIWVKTHGMKAIHWSQEGHDWNASSEQDVVERIRPGLRDGSILLLHDGDRTGKSSQTLKATEQLIHLITREARLPIVPLELPNWTWSRRLMYRLWETWERFYARQMGIINIDDVNIYRINPIQYDGPDLVNEAGDLIAQAGDRVLELHVNSPRLQTAETDPVRIAIGVLRQTKNSLPVLARYIQQQPEYQDIQVLVSKTLLNRGLKGLGFEVTELEDTLHNRWIGFMQRLILKVYHPQNEGTHMGQPKMVWMTRDVLMTKWLPKAQNHTE